MLDVSRIVRVPSGGNQVVGGDWGTGGLPGRGQVGSSHRGKALRLAAPAALPLVHTCIQTSPRALSPEENGCYRSPRTTRIPKQTPLEGRSGC